MSLLHDTYCVKRQIQHKTAFKDTIKYTCNDALNVTLNNKRNK